MSARPDAAHMVLLGDLRIQKKRRRHERPASAERPLPRGEGNHETDSDGRSASHKQLDEDKQSILTPLHSDKGEGAGLGFLHHPYVAVTSSEDAKKGETGVSGVSGWGLKPPASTLRGEEGDVNTKRQQWRVVLQVVLQEPENQRWTCLELRHVLRSERGLQLLRTMVKDDKPC
ncbi:hypothetical protein EYF80_014959 [Liparis tanakae]|uniref:Uncharacterized protein n=1 Tax=Liparis tanakae TaxID=230148 RepID=A0A4Z2I9U9_9TELE|nr:hypothetical protein EYF80_014959 [Liparis tanakae]